MKVLEPIIGAATGRSLCQDYIDHPDKYVDLTSVMRCGLRPKDNKFSVSPALRLSDWFPAVKDCPWQFYPTGHEIARLRAAGGTLVVAFDNGLVSELWRDGKQRVAQRREVMPTAKQGKGNRDA